MMLSTSARLDTKLHLECKQSCRVLATLITAGQAGDSPQFTAVLDAIAVAKAAGGRARVRPDRVLADKAYSSRANRNRLRWRGIKAPIPVPAEPSTYLVAAVRGGGQLPRSVPQETGRAEKLVAFAGRNATSSPWSRLLSRSHSCNPPSLMPGSAATRPLAGPPGFGLYVIDSHSDSSSFHAGMLGQLEESIEPRIGRLH
ncbi:transposase [Nocardia sp. CA-120079]|uniref:transposase n=1 Tax=Nocardia sp. CA-120079 TaxID=3239974 RepID=UPI003D96D51D